MAFFFLFLTLVSDSSHTPTWVDTKADKQQDLAFLMLSIGYLYGAEPALIKAGGAFGILAAFTAWYNALAGIADRTNSFL